MVMVVVTIAIAGLGIAAASPPPLDAAMALELMLVDKRKVTAGGVIAAKVPHFFKKSRRSSPVFSLLISVTANSMASGDSRCLLFINHRRQRPFEPKSTFLRNLQAAQLVWTGEPHPPPFIR